LLRLYPGSFKAAELDGLMRNKAALRALLEGEDSRRIAEDWQDADASFQQKRAQYLLS
jgi:hypothetical protein